MKHSYSALPMVRASRTEYFELFLTATGVLFAILVTASELSRRNQEVSLIFLVWLQGFILWSVHRHNWLLRCALVQKMHSILQDRMKDQFTAMLTMAKQLDLDANGTTRERLEVELTVAEAVWAELERVTSESLQNWGVRDASLALSTPLITEGIGEQLRYPLD
jgi:hypothetical protein